MLTFLFPDQTFLKDKNNVTKKKYSKLVKNQLNHLAC